MRQAATAPPFCDLPLLRTALRSPAARTAPLSRILGRALDRTRFIAVDQTVVDQIIHVEDLDRVREYLTATALPPVPPFSWVESIVEGAAAGMLVALIQRPETGAHFCGMIAAAAGRTCPAQFPLATISWQCDDQGKVIPMSVSGGIHGRPPSEAADELVARLGLSLLAAMASVTDSAVTVTPSKLSRETRREIRARLGLYLAGDVGRRVTLAEGSGT